ncbi:MAG: alpha/beta hydrolase [Catalinimonas sp.]
MPTFSLSDGHVAAGGTLLDRAARVLVLLHGRGATAESILTLARELDAADYAWVALQAPGRTWYPCSFMAPTAQNEPYFSDSLRRLAELHEHLNERGFADDRICWAGFSQGACLTTEFCARHARRWGGVVAFTGGLIGATLDPTHYDGDFAGTPTFLGSSDPDPHVPPARVRDTERTYAGMGAAVTCRIYPGLGHTINADEVAQANQILARHR